MQIELLDILRCPRTGQLLELQDAQYVDDHVRTGALVTEDGLKRYPIREFIPRFVPESNYADNFGMQWNKFRQTQLDSYSGQTISFDRFWKATGWTTGDIAGEWVLDVGCGSGRFSEIALQAGAKVVALDYSSAVDTCYANLKSHPNLYVVQGDIYSLPFIKNCFPFVYSLGVLQHTPDVHGSFFALLPLIDENGRLCVDFYWKRIRTMLHTKYLLRPLTKRMPKQLLFRLLKRIVPFLLFACQKLGAIPLNQTQLKEWALLDTFDMLAPAYDSPQTTKAVRSWCVKVGLDDIEVLHVGHLVARGCKKI